VNFLAFASMSAVTGLYQCFAWFNYQRGKGGLISPTNLKETLLLISPVIISVVLISPEIVFFQTFQVAKLANLYYHNSIWVFLKNFGVMLFIMCRFDLLPAMILVKLLRFRYSSAIRKNNIQVHDRTKQLKALSAFMLLFLVIFALATARMPFIFTRYFIVLQPVIVLLLLTDVLILRDYAALLPQRKPFSFARISFVQLAMLLCLLDVMANGFHIPDYIYQLWHPYRGPLDYYIPALKERFPDSENIVLATNYEELSYEYYLGCKVILGYQNRFETFTEQELQQSIPDAIIIRPFWKQDMQPYEYFLQHAAYEKVTFPVADWPINNMADLNFFMTHQFRTNVTDNENEKAYMYLKASPH
jgi:hypothetical protein